MINIYRVEYNVTYTKQRDVLAKDEQEAIAKVEEEVSWEKPHASEIIGATFVEEFKPGDITHLKSIQDNMRKCARDNLGSGIDSVHECACKRKSHD